MLHMQILSIPVIKGKQKINHVHEEIFKFENYMLQALTSTCIRRKQRTSQIHSPVPRFFMPIHIYRHNCFQI